MHNNILYQSVESRILAVPLDDQTGKLLSSGFKEVVELNSFVHNFAVNPTNRNVYAGSINHITWFDEEINSVMTHKRQSIVYPSAITIDWLTGNIYWVDLLKRSLEIGLIKNNQFKGRVLIEFDDNFDSIPTSIVVDPYHRYELVL